MVVLWNPCIYKVIRLETPSYTDLVIKLRVHSARLTASCVYKLCEHITEIFGKVILLAKMVT